MLALASLSATAPARAQTRSLGGREVDDGSGWGGGGWSDIARPIRQMLFQTAELFRSVGLGALLPIAAIVPERIVLLERSGAEAPVRGAYLIGPGQLVPGGETVSTPPAWHLPNVQRVGDDGTLREIETQLDGPMPYAQVTVCGQPTWAAVVADGDEYGGYGLPGANWYGSGVWFHEWFHGVQPAPPATPDGWTAWDATLRFPAADTELVALAALEQSVLNAPRTSATEAGVALRTFLAIREVRRERFADYVTTTESRETSEGAAHWVEGCFLTATGHIATQPSTGADFPFPPVVDAADPSTWWRFYAGDIAYAGSGILFALTDAVGDAWKRLYARVPTVGPAVPPGPSLPDVVRWFLDQPVGSEAAELVRAAKVEHDFDTMVAAIAAADLPGQVPERR